MMWFSLRLLLQLRLLGTLAAYSMAGFLPGEEAPASRQLAWEPSSRRRAQSSRVPSGRDAEVFSAFQLPLPYAS